MSNHSEKNWTVMVYLAGDNDLNDDMAATLRSLHALRGNPGCNIFAYYATSNLPREAALYDFREKDKENEPLTHSEKPNLGRVSATTLGNSAKVETLINFVKGCREVVHTDHNVLILSAHSDAFLGRSLLADETSMTVMRFSALHDALRQITYEIGGKLDILGFDSCAMGMVEVANELRDCAEVLISPQDFTPSSGWNYEEMLHSLVKSSSPDPDPETHAKCFVKQYVCVQRDFTVGGRSVEIAACRLNDRFEVLIHTIKRLADLLRVELPPVQVPLENATDDLKYGDDTDGITELGPMYSRYINLILCSHWFSQTHMQDQTVDLVHFCLCLIVECEKLKTREVVDPLSKLEEIQRLCSEIVEIMLGHPGADDGIVIASSHAGNQHQFSFGLSLFFPWSRLAFVLSYKTYKNLSFTTGEGKSWMSLVNRFAVETMRQETEDINIVLPVDFGEQFSKTGKYNPPGKGALATFREKFGKVKNYPMEDLLKPKCD